MYKSRLSPLRQEISSKKNGTILQGSSGNSKSSMYTRNLDRTKTINSKIKNLKCGVSKFHSNRNISQYQQQKSLVSNNSVKNYNQEYSVLDGSVVHTSKLDISINEYGVKYINQYSVKKNLGQGSFGKVKLVLNNLDNVLYAIKIIDLKKIKLKCITSGLVNLAQTESFQKEIAILKNLDNKNIVKLHEVIEDDSKDKVYLVMEWVRKGAVMSKDYWKYE